MTRKRSELHQGPNVLARPKQEGWGNRIAHS
ncbi:hypothetical protein T4B_11396 [Trichinella pseudospiralis]|uniref:Uncharacterized protein n=1 Tax=Trichinella pseudospiralis TaxID=6337 RepID=A0A0V1GAE5_TRIPS|nr:hypothetical protein T4B_11396 [Trichinella pseudospiralis]